MQHKYGHFQPALDRRIDCILYQMLRFHDFFFRFNEIRYKYLSLEMDKPYRGVSAGGNCFDAPKVSYSPQTANLLKSKLFCIILQ